MSTTTTEALRFDAENAVARLRAEKIAVANMLYFSATDDIYHFSNSSGSENGACIMMHPNLSQQKHEDEKT